MSAASGIPFLGWPVPVLWRKIGSRSFLAQLESHGQDWRLAYAHGESETLCILVGRQWTEWLAGAFDSLLKDLRNKGSTRLVILASPGLGKLIRRLIVKRKPLVIYAIVPPRKTSFITRTRDFKAVGLATRSPALPDAGLSWPRRLPGSPLHLGPLAIHECLAVFDPIGTAYPVTISSSLASFGLGVVGAEILRFYPKFIRAWKILTRKQRRAGFLKRSPRVRP